VRGRSLGADGIRRGAAAGGALLAVALTGCPTGDSVGTGSDVAPRLDLSAGVERIGNASERLVVSGVSKPVLPATSGEAFSLEVESLPESRLQLAATLTGQAAAGARSGSACRAELRRAADGTALAGVDLDAAAGRWSEAELAVPRVASARLVLECAPPDGVDVRWARPLAVPVRSPSDAPLLVLVSLDTLRADHVSGFGGDPDLTPALGALAAEGLRMQSVSSEGTWTLPSHYSLLWSGLYGFDATRGRRTSLSETLAEHGFATVAMTGGGFVGAFFYFDRGFDHFDESYTEPDGLDRQVRDAIARLDALGTAPTFLFLHTYAVHGKSPAERRLRLGHLDWSPGPEQIDDIREFYAGLVRRLDRDLAPLFAALRSQARRREVLLVVTSDHGEAFLEHGGFRHGYNRQRYSLHDELTRVPLLVWSPSLVPGGRESRVPAMLSDVAPSLLAAVGIEAPAGMRGRSLWPLWTGAAGPTRPGEELPAVSQTDGSWALRGPRFKLIAGAGGEAEPELELYDLQRDPGERVDLAETDPQRARAMLDTLRGRLVELGVEVEEREPSLPDCPLCAPNAESSFLRLAIEGRDTPQQVREALGAATAERLRELGYLE